MKSSWRKLTWLWLTKRQHYSVFKIRKKSGKFRTIYSPDTDMRIVQYRILKFLERFPVPEYIYAFEKGRSVPKMAEIHTGKFEVISIDIKDFFPSITQAQVNALLVGMGMYGEGAKVVSEICTFGPKVPQGALTSPKISNLIAAATFGPKLKEYCDANGFSLTIYADDVTISHDVREESFEDKTVLSNGIIQKVTEILAEEGFVVNREKTKVMREYRRQWVCGAVVNEKVNMLKFRRKKLRAIVHNCEVNGIGTEFSKLCDDPSVFIKKLMGELNWFAQLNAEQGGALKAKFLACVKAYKEEWYEQINVNPAAWRSDIEIDEELEVEVIISLDDNSPPF